MIKLKAMKLSCSPGGMQGNVSQVCISQLFPKYRSQKLKPTNESRGHRNRAVLQTCETGRCCRASERASTDTVQRNPTAQQHTHRKWAENWSRVHPEKTLKQPASKCRCSKSSTIGDLKTKAAEIHLLSPSRKATVRAGEVDQQLRVFTTACRGPELGPQNTYLTVHTRLHPLPPGDPKSSSGTCVHIHRYIYGN